MNILSPRTLTAKKQIIVGVLALTLVSVSIGLFAQIRAMKKDYELVTAHLIQFEGEFESVGWNFSHWTFQIIGMRPSDNTDSGVVYVGYICIPKNFDDARRKVDIAKIKKLDGEKGKMIVLGKVKKDAPTVHMATSKAMAMYDCVIIEY
ncbi:hypothetical protein F4Y93_04930 [Candidatus Poribacteria bacterium]|nr:hypothetical protein [Candidatus Poribacteria bacterium]